MFVRKHLKLIVLVCGLLPLWPLFALNLLYFLRMPDFMGPEPAFLSLDYFWHWTWRLLIYGLGPEPVMFTLWHFGKWALWFLLLTLCVTPLRNMMGWTWPLLLRRMLGLLSFLYAFAHLVVYFAFEVNFRLDVMWEEVMFRPYIAVGMLALLVMVPLAMTSTNKMVRRLGIKRWRMLHKMTYGIAILAVLHFYWMKSAKNLVTEPLIYAAVLAILLGYRVADHMGYAPRANRKLQT